MTSTTRRSTRTLAPSLTLTATSAQTAVARDTDERLQDAETGRDRRKAGADSYTTLKPSKERASRAELPSSSREGASRLTAREEETTSPILRRTRSKKTKADRLDAMQIKMKVMEVMMQRLVAKADARRAPGEPATMTGFMSDSTDMDESPAPEDARAPARRPPATQYESKRWTQQAPTHRDRALYRSQEPPWSSNWRRPSCERHGCVRSWNKRAEVMRAAYLTVKKKARSDEERKHAVTRERNQSRISRSEGRRRPLTTKHAALLHPRREESESGDDHERTTSPSAHLKLPTPTMYKPSCNIEAWLARVDMHMRHINVQSSRKRALTYASLLTAEAYDRLWKLRIPQAIWNDGDALRKQLQLVFGECKTLHSYRAEFTNAKQQADEVAVEFFDRIYGLLLSAYPGEDPDGQSRTTRTAGQSVRQWPAINTTADGHATCTLSQGTRVARSRCRERSGGSNWHRPASSTIRPESERQPAAEQVHTLLRHIRMRHSPN